METQLRSFPMEWQLGEFTAKAQQTQRCAAKTPQPNGNDLTAKSEARLRRNRRQRHSPQRHEDTGTRGRGEPETDRIHWRVSSVPQCLCGSNVFSAWLLMKKC